MVQIISFINFVVVWLVFFVLIFFYNTLRKHDLEGLFKLFVFVQQVYEASHTDADQHEDVVDASNTVTNAVETD